MSKNSKITLLNMSTIVYSLSMKFTLRWTDSYTKWFDSQTAKMRRQIGERFQRIEVYGHFGHDKNLGDELWELKFNNGNRIYYSIKGNELIILLHGGNKNGQSKDIQKARKILSKIK